MVLVLFFGFLKKNFGEKIFEKSHATDIPGSIK